MKEIAYEMPWRTNYEAMAAAGSLVGATGAIAAEMLTELPPEPFWWMKRFPRAWRCTARLRLIVFISCRRG